ncbi:MAG: TetR family transcriptional regulator C-terminal domain-containing protein [Gammaproteobacteria bacterium]|nr:TetR family transcriptional regulator C-terminal domain-containing protein [Gammaproteobacteria bacterium]
MPKVVDHEKRRREFIKAAYETIREEGLAGTTVRAVAKRAGFTTGALVHYFGDKDELIRLALEYSGEQVRERMNAANQACSGRAALHQVLVEALPLDKRRSANWRLWLAMWYHSESNQDMRAEEKRRYREWTKRLEQPFLQSVELGELPPQIDISAEVQGLIAFIDGLGVQHLMSSRRMSSRQLMILLDRYLDRIYGAPS